MRSAECLKMRLMLSPAGGGDLVELAAVLGNGRHNYTLSAQSPGVAFMLPLEALEQAFRSYPQLRMQLLEELAREVSRAYHSCRLIHAAQGRRQGLKGAQA
jgi:CRP-like cAMP-binding protein